MSALVNTHAFINIEVRGPWVLPPEYKEALEPHIETDPTSLLLPWPTEMIPSKGWKLLFSNMLRGFDEVVVENIECIVSKSGGIEVHIKCGPVDSSRLVLPSLLYASEEGFELESGKSIKKILDAAGLQSSHDHA